MLHFSSTGPLLLHFRPNAAKMRFLRSGPIHCITSPNPDLDAPDIPVCTVAILSQTDSDRRSFEKLPFKYHRGRRERLTGDSICGSISCVLSQKFVCGRAHHRPLSDANL